MKNDGCLDLSHSSGWRHFEISKDQERNVIQIQRRPKRRSEERGKMFMVAYIIFAEAAGTNFYLPKSLVIKKNNQEIGHKSRLWTFSSSLGAPGLKTLTAYTRQKGG